jgi:hypothetical protein
MLDSAKALRLNFNAFSGTVQHWFASFRQRRYSLFRLAARLKATPLKTAPRFAKAFDWLNHWQGERAVG